MTKPDLLFALLGIMYLHDKVLAILNRWRIQEELDPIGILADIIDDYHATIHQ